jgi:hypothetical protein
MITSEIIRVVNPAAAQLLCIHALTGRAPCTKMCANNYECGSCEFDQVLEDMAEVDRKIATPSKARMRAA